MQRKYGKNSPKPQGRKSSFPKIFKVSVKKTCFKSWNLLNKKMLLFKKMFKKLKLLKLSKTNENGGKYKI